LVKIRLKRMGATKRPFYRLVVADSRSPRDGRFIEEIGVYDPIARPATVRIDEERVRDWMRKGARPSDTARKLLEQQGILPRTARPTTPPKPKAEPAAAATATAVAPAETEVAAETHAEQPAEGDVETVEADLAAKDEEGAE
jgi:small subunit ribosomal protein S16